MKWYHFSVEYFEDLRNVNHCEFLIMRKKEDSGKYILENNLRTWSDLKRERLAAAAAREKANPSTSAAASTSVSEKDKEKEKKLLGASTDGVSAVSSLTTVPVRKKWGGCPNGCDHGKHYFKKENSMHAMQLNGRPSPAGSPITGPIETIQFRRPAARRWQSSSEEDEDDPRGRVGQPFQVDVEKSLDDMVSSPDGTPSFISVEDRLRNRLKSPKNDLLLVRTAGRDFGGSASGNTSQAGSDTEFSAEEDTRKRLAKGKSAGFRGAGGAGHGSTLGNGNSDRGGNGTVSLNQLRKLREESSMGRGAMADALGDQSDVGSDAGSEAEPDIIKELEREENHDKSVIGSVY